MRRLGLFLCYLILFTFAHSLFAEEVNAEWGILDLRNRDLEGVKSLKGGWGFHSEASDMPYLYVPGGWSDITGYEYGEGVYRLTVLRSKPVREVALLIPDLSQDLKIRAGERLIYDSSDRQGKLHHSSRPIIILDRVETVTLTFELNNIFFREGGFHHVPLYGSYTDIMQVKNRALLLEMTVVIIALFIFIYTFYLYYMRYTTISSLYLGLGSLSFAMRGLFEGEYIIEMLFPAFPLILSYRANFAFLYFGSAAMILFIIEVFRPDRRGSSAFFRVSSGVGVILGAACFFIPMKLLSSSIYLLQGYGFFLLVTCLFLVFKAVRKNFPDSRTVFVGSLLLMFFSFADALSILGHFQIISGTQTGLLLFLLTQMLVITRKFGRSYLKAEHLSHELEAEVERQTLALKKLSFTDSLTGLNNRRRFFELAQREATIHKRYNHPMTVMLLDLDHFKQINDTYGHSVGDKALEFLARSMEREVRDSDIIGRLGGEEFAIILLETGLPAALEAAERIRQNLEAETRDRKDSIPPMTISIGLVDMSRGEELEEALERADALMYKAKEAGRNRVEY